MFPWAIARHCVPSNISSKRSPSETSKVTPPTIVLAPPPIAASVTTKSLVATVIINLCPAIPPVIVVKALPSAVTSCQSLVRASAVLAKVVATLFGTPVLFSK